MDDSAIMSDEITKETVPTNFNEKKYLIDGFIVALDGKNKHLILFDYGLFNKICDKIKYL